MLTLIQYSSMPAPRALSHKTKQDLGIQCQTFLSFVLFSQGWHGKEIRSFFNQKLFYHWTPTCTYFISESPVHISALKTQWNAHSITELLVHISSFNTPNIFYYWTHLIFSLLNSLSIFYHWTPCTYSITQYPVHIFITKHPVIVRFDFVFYCHKKEERLSPSFYQKEWP